MSLGESEDHRPQQPKRRKPGPAAAGSGRSERGPASDVTFFFRGGFPPETRSAIEETVTAMEEGRSGSNARASSWLILTLGPEGASFVAAIRLTDGRTYRAATSSQLVADLQAVADGN